MTHASVCSGLDGPALAAAWLGWENLFHADINEFTNHILKYFYPDATTYTDIRKTDFTPWRGRVDVFTAGFPCQPFSVAGKRTGQDHDSYLWDETLRVVGEVRPRWFVGENVDGINTMVFPGPEALVGSQTDLFGTTRQVYERVDRYIVDRICDDLESIGYEVRPVVIPACAVSAPHRRDRVFFVCHDAENPFGVRRDGDKPEEKPSEREQRLAGSGDRERLCGKARVAADRPDAGPESLQKREDRVYAAGFAADPGSKQQQEWAQNHVAPDRTKDGSGTDRRVERLGDIRTASDTEWIDGRVWENFPTQPPICSRDDGISGRISGLTVSTWRRKAIEALGNAIVPQQIYEILRLIEIIENNLKNE